MKKSYRVKKETHFQEVFTKGKSCANRQFVIYTLEKPQQPHFRVGISVGKKIGNAVQRNWVKRRIRESLKQLKPQIKKDCDFIVIARPSVTDMALKDIKQHLIHILKIAKVLEENN